MKNTAATVTREKAAVAEKRDELLVETGMTLDQVVAAVRPALPALVQRPPPQASNALAPLVRAPRRSTPSFSSAA